MKYFADPDFTYVQQNKPDVYQDNESRFQTSVQLVLITWNPFSVSVISIKLIIAQVQGSYLLILAYKTLITFAVPKL